jgi:hypothetical protein
MRDGITMRPYDAFKSLLDDPECTGMILRGYALPLFHHTRA